MEKRPMLIPLRFSFAEVERSLKKTMIRAIALLLLVLLVPVSAAGQTAAKTTRYTKKRKTTSPPRIVVPTPWSGPVPTPIPAAADGAGIEQPEATGAPAKAGSGFSFGYADIPAGLEAYPDTEGSDVVGVFSESGYAYAASAADGWVKLVFISAGSQEIMEAYVHAGDVTETHAVAADALRTRLSKYQPVYYQGYPLPTIRFELLSELSEEESSVLPDMENGEEAE